MMSTFALIPISSCKEMDGFEMDGDKELEAIQTEANLVCAGFVILRNIKIADSNVFWNL
jgi:hypothetical protein